jgi:hypothetical protein
MKHKARFKIKRQGAWLNALGLPLTQQCHLSRNLTLVDLRTPIGHAPIKILIPTPRDLPTYAKDDHH